MKQIETVTLELRETVVGDEVVLPRTAERNREVVEDASGTRRHPQHAAAEEE